VATQRPATLTVAAILIALLSLGDLALPLLAAVGGPPLPIVAAFIALGVACLVATRGLWACKAWGARVAVVVSAVNAIAALPGFTQAHNAGVLIGAVGGVGSTLVIVLVLLPASRRAYA
jgi:hypothetical protein